jgi:hypothetical protein
MIRNRFEGLRTMSEWRAERNTKALARLEKALPSIFPAPVLARALRRPFIPPMPRLAIDGYWRAHPVRADRLARALAARSGTPAGWTWSLGAGRDDGLPATFRAPPAPFREPAFARGPGACCVCGQPVYRFGWHADLWGAGSNKRAGWHAACVIAWELWTAPSDFVRILKQLQARRHRNVAWPQLLAFWGVPNLQVINRDAHAAKCASEANDRRNKAVPAAGA